MKVLFLKHLLTNNATITKSVMDPQDSQGTIPPPTDPAKLAKFGISLLINNRAAEAEELFRTNSESIQVSAGHAFVVLMDAIMSFDHEKLGDASTILREVEKKCAADMGWLKSVRDKVWGSKTINAADRLETQIILADTQICIALITFLQHEFTGYLKGGWILRKAWKIYHETYLEIANMYRQKIGTFNLPEPTDFEWSDNTVPRSSSVGTSGSPEDIDTWAIPDPNSASNTPRASRNGYAPISSPVHKPNIPHSQSTYIFSKTKHFFPFSIRRSDSAHSSLTKNSTASDNTNSTFSLFSPFSSQLSFLTSTFNLLTSGDNKDIDQENVARLMGAVCFGYGVLQLGLSLLPPSLLKVTSFFGFSANRTAGISNLMYARKGTDMRAPLATLVLLWYHTIVRPFYGLDGSNLKAGLEASTLLIEEAKIEYYDSALFLFFEGRTHRLDGNIPKALESFQLASNNSVQRELKILTLHEVGWCYILQLDYAEAHKTFLKVKAGSRWSKSFYFYLIIICSGSNGGRNFGDIQELITWFSQAQKANQLDTYIRRRMKIFPASEAKLMETHNNYWKMFVYELIYLWNALPSCSSTTINDIIEDCNETIYEPMPGLAKLIQGECFNITGHHDNAVSSLRECIDIRSKITPRDDVHVSAFGEYTLGVLLVKDSMMHEEGKLMLEHCSQYKDYDFDNTLLVRINMALKNVS